MRIDDDEDFDGDFDPESLSEEEKMEIEKKMKDDDKKARAHPLVKQAQEILNIVDTLLDTRSDATEDMYGDQLRNSAMIVFVKVSATVRCDMYTLCMQNAAIIRDNAEYLRLSNHLLSREEGFDPRYIKMFRSEMEKFRKLFRAWAKEIHKMNDHMEDEWGLFLK